MKHKQKKSGQIKSVWKTKGVKAWISISSALLVFLITVTSIGLKVPFLYNTLNSVLGRERRVLVSGNPDEYARYIADYADKTETLAAANLLNEQICEEGIVLLKNEGNVLPLATSQKITVFGKNSVNLILGGSGSSSGSADGGAASNLYTSLTNAGFTLNPVMEAFYDSDASGSGRPATPGMGSILTGYPVAETPLSLYTAEVRSSYAQYPDAAVAVISRIGGEGYDMPRTMFWNGSNYTTWTGNQIIPGARDKDDHYLQLDQNETDMLKEACDNFSKVIVVINCSTSMELGFLDDSEHYAYNANIKAALWIGNPGKTGINALGRVLNGEVNPSGKTVDTYARDFRKDPTWNNFGNNRVNDGNRYTLNGAARNAYFVEYREGIYVGYRYYETRAFTEEGNWYNENVVFPFGFGLSYTAFNQEIETVSLPAGSVLTADSVIEITVKVTNEGIRSGKDVVQLYYTPLYYTNGIEKAHVVLGDFKKTGLLAPGESESVILSLKARDMASYDFSDANGNGFNGYELDTGTYAVNIMRDSHMPIGSVNYLVSGEGIKYETDSATGCRIENLFDDVSSHINTYLSRADWTGTWPKTVTGEDRAVTQEFISSLTFSVTDNTADPWYSGDMPVQSSYEMKADECTVKLYDLIGKDYNDPLWDELLNQLTVTQMKKLITMGNFRTVNIDNISKPSTIDADGPMGFAIFMGDASVYDTCYYASECVIGATWNVCLAEQMGKMVGNEGIIGNEKGDGSPYSGWYAPAMNIHRSQFGGRNFEYYSEDGLLSGKLASAVVKGAKTKGVYTYLKHFALNDQETNRDTTGLITWANEQAMRELYFLPFETAVKEGGSIAVMSSFNRIGTVWAGGNYTLLTKLLRDEWGFRGMVITDFNLTSYMNVDQMIRAGGDLNLSPNKDLSSSTSVTSITAIRRSAKNILYTVANSNAMNGVGKNVVYSYAPPLWVIWLILSIAGIFLLCCGWGVLAIIKAKKKLKAIN